MLTALYRLWFKCRQELATRWAGVHDRPLFAAGRDRPTIDPVWRHSVRNQTAKGEDKHIATLS